MRIAFSLLAFSVTAILAVTPSSASIFGKDKQPVPQWGLEAYKVKTPDYAKDAPAVVLFSEDVETVDAQGRAVERLRRVTRILKPQGRENGICGVAYDVDEKINYLRVWTIGADEKQYQAQETDFGEEGDTNIPVMLSTNKFKFARPPAVDVGAVVVCESEELQPAYSQETIWQIQRSIPVVLEALEVDLPPGRPYSEAWHKYQAVKPTEVAPNHWRWEIKDMPALILRDIPSRPEWEALAARMSVQWGDAAVAGKDNEWRAIGEWVTKLETDRPAPSPEITAKVQELEARFEAHLDGGSFSVAVND